MKHLALALVAGLALAGASAACGHGSYGVAGSAYAAPVVAPVVAAVQTCPQAFVAKPAQPVVAAEVEYHAAPSVAPVLAVNAGYAHGYGAVSAFAVGHHAQAVVVRHRAAFVTGHAGSAVARPAAVVVQRRRGLAVRRQAVVVNAPGVKVRVRGR